MNVLRRGFVLVTTRPQRMRKPCRRSGKYTWLSEQDADMVVRLLGNTGSSYYCNHCRGWHVTRRAGLR